jgi:hypothetical protein
MEIAKRIRKIHRTVEESPVPRIGLGISIDELAEEPSDSLYPAKGCLFRELAVSISENALDTLERFIQHVPQKLDLNSCRILGQ